MTYEKPEETNPEAAEAAQVPLPSVEEINRRQEELGRRLEEAKKGQEAEIKKQLTDRESLIKKARENVERIMAASKLVADYEMAIARADIIRRDTTREIDEGYENAKNLLASLEKVQADIDAQIELIESRPEALNSLLEKAEKEGVRREAEKIIQEKREEVRPEIAALAAMIGPLAEAWEFDRQKGKQLEEANYNLCGEVDGRGGFISKIREMDQGYANTMFALWRDNEIGTEEDVRRRLEAEKEKLGFLDRKKKKAIDYILANMSIIWQARRKGDEYQNHWNGLFKESWGPLQVFRMRLEGVFEKLDVGVLKIREVLGRKTEGKPSGFEGEFRPGRWNFDGGLFQELDDAIDSEREKGKTQVGELAYKILLQMRYREPSQQS